MAKIDREAAEVNARIVYWGIEGAGKTTNLRTVHARLRPDHRGQLREIASRLDPTVHYEVVPIELGEIAGMRTRIQLIAPPGAPEQAPTRKLLLDQVDGIVLVVDAQSDRADENVASFEELRSALAAYGRSLERIPLVIQYNKCDLADPLAIEDLHRKLDLGGVPVFETVASARTGVLETLSTISKRVIRSLRDSGATRARPAPPEPAPHEPMPTEIETDLEPEAPPQPPASSAARMEQAILAEPEHPQASEIDASLARAEGALEDTWRPVSGEIARPAGVRLGSDLTIVSVGEATRASDRSVRLPVVLGDASGQTSSLTLTIQLDPVIDPDGE
jgi:signal recognition particle receptor subunit beta